LVDKKFNLLWHSVAPFVYSGYGIVTKNVALRLGQKYPMIISCYYGLHTGASLRIANVRVVPVTDPNHGEESVKHYIEKFKIDLPILASDFWPFPWFAEMSNSMFYGPVDSYDYSQDDINVMRNYSYFIPCSNFGGKVYKKLTGRDPLAIIPHGVDLQIYKHYPKIESRKLFNLKRNKFYFGIVAANSDGEPRKGWDDLMITFQRFKEEFPNEAKKWMIFAYTKPSDIRGFNLFEMARKSGLEKHVIFPEHLAQVVGIPDFEMAKLYSCFDVFVNASRREGFCIPVIEAQACGIPVIASNSSSLPEIVKGHGWLTKMGQKYFTPKGWPCERVSRDDLLKQIEDAYFNRELRRKYSSMSLNFAKGYDWNDIVKTQWLPLLEDLRRKGLNIISSN